MQVWDSAGTGFIQYDTAHLSEATMGHVAENGVIQHALMKRLLPTVDRLWPVSAFTRPLQVLHVQSLMTTQLYTREFRQSLQLY